MDNLKKALTSKKFYVLLVSLVFIFFGERAGLTQEAVTEAVKVLIAYILGQGLADIRKA